MSRQVFTIAALVLMLGVAGYAASDEAPAGPQVSKAMAKPLKAAQEAVQAKKYTDALARLKEAEAIPDKTPYDQFVIAYLYEQIYVPQNDPVSAAPYLEQLTQSQYTPAASKLSMYKALMSINLQQKNYPKAEEFALDAIKAGDSSDETVKTLGQIYYIDNKLKESAVQFLELINRADQAGHKPDEKVLVFYWEVSTKLKDDAAAGKALDKLVALYPKPEYWQNAMVSLQTGNIHDDRLLINIYRLKAEVGILNQPADFTDMAQIALDQGNPGEAESVMQQAFTKKVYSDPHDVERNQRLLDTAHKAAAADRAAMAKNEKDAEAAPTGDALVQIGAAYLGFGDPQKASDAIDAGIAKGSLKRPNEAYLLLGIARARQKNAAEAGKAFAKVSGDPKYVRLAKLWGLATHT
jgi:tetratricopeptide repeat protein